MQKFCKHCGQPVLPRDFDVLVCKNNHENWINPAPGAMAYIIKDGTALFGVRSIEPGKGLLDVPGGFLKPHETAEQAVVREAEEEMGIHIVLRDVLGTYNAEGYDGQRSLTVVFIADYAGGDIVPGDDMEGGDAVWRAIDDLPARNELAWKWQERAQADLQAWYQTHM